MAAGPSSSAGPDMQQLKDADEKYEAGMASLRANDLDKAVELLGAALQTRIQAHGDLAPECASAYHHYGTAIFYKAQEEQDVFGAPLQQAAEEQEDDGEEGDNRIVAATDANKENVDEKGKAPLRAEDVDGTEETDEPEDDDDEEEDDAKEGDAGDMQLAWEMLEVARSIYLKMGDAKALALADVYVLLGDIGMEEERFDSSATDYESALKLLSDKLEADDRRIAEAHYKLALTLHFLELPERALEHANKAVAVCNARIARLSLPQGAADSTAEPSPEAEKEIADLRAVLDDLAAKVEDLEAAVKEKEATRKALRDAFSQVAGSFSGGASGSGQNTAAQPPSGPSASAVVNLGVVGRGNKRINLQPVAATAPAGADATGAAAEPTQKPKRSFEDIMGGGAATSLGFGSPVVVPQGFGTPAGSTFPPAAAAGDAQVLKKPKAGEAQGASVAVPADNGCAAAGGSAAPAPSSVPAFLQAGQVAKTYGQQAAQTPTTEGS